VKDSSFLITNPKQIIHNLTLLWKAKCLLSVYFGDNNESFITAIIEIDPKKNSLRLDAGPKEYLNQQLLASKNVSFKTELSGIQVAFAGKNLSKSRRGDQAALCLPIPETITWVERRKFYRIKSPLSNPASCRFDLAEAVTVSLNLHDISISGFSLLYDNPEFSEQLIPTAHFDRCKLFLPDIGHAPIAFTVRNKLALNPDKPDKTQRIGCEFASITPAIESEIQRYMQLIERAIRKTS